MVIQNKIANFRVGSRESIAIAQLSKYKITVSQNRRSFLYVKHTKKLSLSLVAEALREKIPVFSPVHTCLMMGEASLETSPKNNMIQDMINSDNII